PNITTLMEERISIASAALEKALDFVNVTTGQFSGFDTAYETAASLYAQMADLDGLTNQTKFKDVLKDTYFPQAEITRTDFLDEFTYGYAAVHAYFAYNDSDFLNFAEVSWNSGNRYTLSASEIESGVMSLKSFPILQSCSGNTMAGGTFSVSPLS
ncbi:hypothetical protein BT96DRAFT_840772, partial [Gymnopus androsaceus JB14]